MSMTDEPLTPVGRFFSQPLMDQVIHCAVAVEFPIDADAFKAGVSRSIMLENPRFCSLMVRDSGGREHWRRTTVDIDRHDIIHPDPLPDADGDDEDAVNDFMADISVSSPLPVDKPLWEVHLLLAHNAVVFRVHHALGDGTSLMSLLLSCCRRADDPSRRPIVGGVRAAPSGRRRCWTTVWALAMTVWCGFITGALEVLLRSLWVKDRTTALNGSREGVELWPRKLTTAKLRLDDMQIVKRAVAGATLNDVIVGVISCGFSRYLEIRSPEAVPEGLRITGMVMMNLRPQKGLQDLSILMNKNSGMQWGNIFGPFLLPMYYHRDPNSDVIQFVKAAKSIMDKKKRSLVAHFMYRFAVFVDSFSFGAKLNCMIAYKVLCNTTFMFSNLVGPTERILLGKNPVKYIRVSSTSLPQAITMHMVTYAGMGNLQILVAKDHIPDPKVLAQCFEQALLDMKQAALVSK